MAEQTSTASQNPQFGVSKPPQPAKTPSRDPKITARDQLLAEMDARIVEQRAIDDETFFQTADPRAIALAAEMGRESRGEKTLAEQQRDGQGRFTSAAAGEEAIPDEPEAQPIADEQTQVDARGNDPLEAYIVRDSGKEPMFKTVVDGKVRLIPLEKARAQLQKHIAVDERMKAVSAQQAQLNARAQQLAQQEAELNRRAALPPPVVVDDASLDNEASELVRSLVSEPESVAAKKMANVLKKIRSAAPQIDVTTLGRQAASIAKQEIAVEGHQRALVDGRSKFDEAYPEIVADSDLFELADSKTVKIAAEHPEWSPEEIMMEAGKQVSEKFVTKSPGKRPNIQTGPSLREQAKQKLVPMPQSRVARPVPAGEQTEDLSPSGALAEIRKARGQAY